MIRSGLFGIFFVASFLFVARAHAASLDPILPVTTCGSLDAPGTYTLGSNIGSGGSCLTVTSDSVIIDGAGQYVVNGNIIGANGVDGITDINFNSTNGTDGVSYTLQNITINGSVTSGGGGNGGWDGNGNTGGNAGNGGSITIINSTTTSITTGGGGNGGGMWVNFLWRYRW